MVRPQSIVWFERLYIAAVVFGVISTAQTWTMQVRLLDSDPTMAAMPWIPAAAAAARAVLALALWYLVARLGSVVAKWIVVVLAAWGVILLAMMAYGLTRGSATIDVVLSGALQNLLYLAAAVMLFRPDAQGWFARRSNGEVA